MKWIKKGRIELEKYMDGNKLVSSFAMLPTPLLITEDTIRVYIGFCDGNNVGRIGYVDVCADNPQKVQNISTSPVLDIGRPGCFDDNGVVPLSVLEAGDEIYLYYVGFQTGVKVPYFMFGGLAISRDGGDSFRRVSEAPVVDRKDDELFARCGMNVMKDHDIYKMWYVGTINEGWVQNHGSLKPLYTMRYMESEDGIHWDQPSVSCMQFSNEDEHGFGRPYVWKVNGAYKMLYSIRTYSRGYYIGYAESVDGVKWIRKDELAGICTSASGWDSQNISYPCMLQTKGRTYLFFNGNSCGRTGFGYAELAE